MHWDGRDHHEVWGGQEIGLVEAGTGPKEAVAEVIEAMRTRVGGSGGVVSVNQLGIDWNTEHMVWAGARSGEIHYGVQKGDDFVEEL